MLDDPKMEVLQELLELASRLKNADNEDWTEAGYKRVVGGVYPAFVLGDIYFQTFNGKIRLMENRNGLVSRLSDGEVWSGRKVRLNYSWDTYYYTKGMRWTVYPNAPQDIDTLETYRDLLREACQKLANVRLAALNARARGKSRRPQAAKE